MSWIFILRPKVRSSHSSKKQTYQNLLLLDKYHMSLHSCKHSMLLVCNNRTIYGLSLSHIRETATSLRQLRATPRSKAPCLILFRPSLLFQQTKFAWAWRSLQRHTWGSVRSGLAITHQSHPDLQPQICSVMELARLLLLVRKLLQSAINSVPHQQRCFRSHPHLHQKFFYHFNFWWIVGHWWSQPL